MRAHAKEKQLLLLQESDMLLLIDRRPEDDNLMAVNASVRQQNSLRYMTQSRRRCDSYTTLTEARHPIATRSGGGRLLPTVIHRPLQHPPFLIRTTSFNVSFMSVTLARARRVTKREMRTA